jgi:bacillopeptidase F (M6 metalloprotease family)
VWTNMSFDLSGYAGTTIILQWGTFNNGTNGITSMYVDDVTLQVCP